MESEDIDIENDSVETIAAEPGRPSDDYEQAGIVHRNPVAIDDLPRNIEDIYSSEPILFRQHAAPIVFNVDNCVDVKKLCQDIPWCPPDNESSGEFYVNYVLPAERVNDVGDLTIDGLAPWNSRDDGNYMKSTIKSVAVQFHNGSVHMRNMDGRTQVPCDCVLRCFYAKNPNESKLTKRAFFAITNRRDKRPRPGTFVVISYEYSSGPARLYPRVHKSARHRHAFKRTRSSMADLIKEELKCRSPRDARDAVVRKVGLSKDIRVDDVIPMRAVYDIAKNVKDRARVMKQGRKPGVKKDKSETEADFLPDAEDLFVMREPSSNEDEAYRLVEDGPYYDGVESVIDADVEVVSSEHVECQPCYNAIEVSDFKAFYLHTVFLEELSKTEQKKLIEKAQRMKVISTPHFDTNLEYNVVCDEDERKSFYVDLNVDLAVEPPYCECGYSGKRRICAHVLATLYQRVDGQYLIDTIQARIQREQRAMESTRLQRMRRALNSDVPSTSQASTSAAVATEPSHLL
ncbi:hypothetical protein AAVH_02346 [Aphelenchoides avenae]|nr:hypothetical protein AAVH_02346 [Aphelenchus avenae]